MAAKCLSIRSLAIALTVSSVVTVTLVVSIMMIVSTQQALNDLKGSRDASVTDCFAVSEQSITDKTEELLTTLGNSTEQYLLNYLEDKRLITIGLLRQLEMFPPALVLQWGYIFGVARGMWQTMKLQNPQGVTSLSIVSQKAQMVTYVEDEDTVGRGPDEYHHLKVEMCNGTDFDVPGVRDARVNATGYASADLISGLPYGGIGVEGDCTKTAVASNGTILEDWCFNPKNDPLGLLYPGALIMTAAKGQGPENSFWSPLIKFDKYLGLFSFGSFRGEGGTAPIGIMYTGIDVRQVTTFLRTIKVGGEDSKGRLFTLVRQDWKLGASLQGYDQTHWVTGVSHGQPTGVDNAGLIVPLTPPDVSDVLISNCGKFIKTLPDPSGNTSSDPRFTGMYESLAGYGTKKFNMSVTVREGGNFTEDIPREEFFVLVRTLNDGHNVDWYMVLLIDRLSVLGEVDKAFVDTKHTISERERKIDANLAEARVVLFVIISVIGVGLVAASVVLVVQITQPLLVLEAEMAEVALMRLNAVKERPISKLYEVGCMQVSFAALLHNLREYRNYMPLSVLQDDDDSTEEEFHNVESMSIAQATSPASSGGDNRSVTSGKSSSTVNYVDTAIGKAMATDLKKKTITVVVTNIQDFHSMSIGDFGVQHSKYISAILQQAKEAKGVPDMFAGDRVLVTFNSLKACSLHSTTGCRFASRVVDVMHGEGVVCSAGVATGDAKCGNLGTLGMKKYSSVGVCVSWASALERLCKKLVCGVALDGRVYATAKSMFYAPLMTCASFPKMSQHLLDVHALREEHKHSGDEWMYELQEADRQDPYKEWSATVRLYLNGDYERALAVLECLVEKGGTEWVRARVEGLKGQVSSAMSLGTAPPRPVEALELKYY